MRSSTSRLTAMLVLGIAILAAKNASAGGFHFGGGGHGGHGGHKGHGVALSFGGHKHGFHHDHHHNYHHHGHYHHVPVHRYYVQPALVYDRSYYPTYRSCFVYPGDTWYSICQRIYGCTYLWKHIATYNGLPLTTPLVSGQQLMLPVINANGTLAASNAPASPAIAPVAAPMASANRSLAAPSASIEPVIPSIEAGSTMMFNGESMGNAKGIARLRMGNVALPLEVIEWNATSAKIQLPKMDLASPMKAELELLRADGSVVSTSAIELKPAASRLALDN